MVACWRVFSVGLRPAQLIRSAKHSINTAVQAKPKQPNRPTLAEKHIRVQTPRDWLWWDQGTLCCWSSSTPMSDPGNQSRRSEVGHLCIFYLEWAEHICAGIHKKECWKVGIHKWVVLEMSFFFQLSWWEVRKILIDQENWLMAQYRLLFYIIEKDCKKEKEVN